MDRRNFVQMGIAAGAAAAVNTVALAAAKPGADTVVELGAREQQARMQAGTLSSQSLVRQYLERIAAIDRAGPRINAVIELNPDAMVIAAGLDRERAAGKVRGPLHGLTVLLKDNIATGDRMSTTAGSLALEGVRATRDAHVVAQLRAAGVVIIGKTNLSEWANLRSTRSTSGWSGRGGLTRNPYALDRNTSGSSAGSGAAVAASLATFAVGTETDGSIVSPSSVNGIVGIKPTMGLVSRSGIIPISHSQDTAGPMARTVADAALLLAAMAGVDESDAVTRSGAGRAGGYAAALVPGGLKGKRLGVVRAGMGRYDKLDALTELALAALKAEGAILVDVTVPNTAKYRASELDVLLYEFKPGVAAWLADYAPHAPVKNMADVIAFNNRNAERSMPHFGQEYLIRAQAKGGLDTPEYVEALANCRRYAGPEGIDQVMKQFKLDALVAPTTGPAWLTDYVAADHGSGGFSSPAAVAGYPHITVPAGYLYGLPVGLSFVGAAWSEASLISMAYGFEQATRLRKAPRFAASAGSSA